MDIGQRLEQFIQYQSKSKAKFAEQMGWGKQYLHNLTNGQSFGLKPVEAILRKFPELDARWLILGEGAMLSEEYAEGAKVAIRNRIAYLEKLEELLPYMTQEQIKKVCYMDSHLSEVEIKELEEKAKSGT